MNPGGEQSEMLLRVRLQESERNKTMKGLKDIETQTTRIGKELDKAGREGKAAFDKIQREAAATREKLAAAGDVSTNLGAVSALGRLGGLDIGIGQDIADLVEQLPNLRTSLAQMPQAIGAFATSLGPLGLAAAAAGAILAVTLSDLTREFEAAKVATLNEIELRSRLRLLREQGNKEDVQAQIDAAQQRFNTAQSQVELAESIVDGFIDGLATEAEKNIARSAIQKRIEDGNFFLTGLSGEVVGAIETLRKAGPEAEGALVELAGLNNVLNDASVQTRTLAESETNLTSIREDAANRLNQSLLQTTLEASRLNDEQLAERIASISEERRVLNEFIQTGRFTGAALDEANRRFAELGSQMSVFLDAVPEARVRASLQSLTSISEKTLEIADAGEKRLASIREQGAKQLESAEKSLAQVRRSLSDFEDETRASRGEAESEYRSTELERTEDFQKDLLRLNEDGARRLLELTNQLKEDEFQAELGNSTAQFLQARRNFEQQSAQEKGNLSLEARRRLEDFNDESQRNEKLLQEKLAGIDTEAAARRADLQAQLAERADALETVKAEIADRVQAEEAAIRSSLHTMVSSFDASTQQMTGISTAAMAILQQNGISAVAGIVAELRAKATLGSLNTSSQLSLLKNSAGQVKLGGGGMAFARGGVVNRPTLALLGEGGPEMVIPFRQSDGIERGLARNGIGGQSIVFNHYGDVTADPKMTRGEFVRVMKTEILPEIGNGVARARGMA